ISNPLIPYVLTQSYIWVHYFISFFLPFNLTADSDSAVIANPFDERILIGCIFVVFLLITIIRTSIKPETRPIAFGLIWFSVALLPTSLAPFAEVTNDHRMYFPFIGLMLSVVTYAGLLIKRHNSFFENKRNFSYLFILLFCILGLNVYGIYNRNKVWHDEESLWHDVSIKSPLNGRGLMNYGLALMDKGKYAEAEKQYKAAEKFVPTYSYLYINEAVLYGAQHKNSEAEENFEKAISLQPDDFTSYTFYARFLLDIGRTTDAQAKAEKALQLNPGSEMALNLLLKIYNQLGYWDQLGKTAKQYLTIIPGDKFAQQCLQASQTHQKVVIAGTASVAKPVTAEDFLNQSLDYYNEGKYDKCIEASNQALKLKPNYADAWNNIGAAYIKLTQWDKAIDACKKALAINPNHNLANNNLKYAESQLKK
ncbi:MAG TPA: tetratricopeptide repeat protein, partial [Mucilaginibacter sp.]|nr:tetratricopeptide repeat protein [Mucilaginibacter sp.]